jgi:hypothetical protein
MFALVAGSSPQRIDSKLVAGCESRADLKIFVVGAVRRMFDQVWGPSPARPDVGTKILKRLT